MLDPLPVSDGVIKLIANCLSISMIFPSVAVMRAASSSVLAVTVCVSITALAVSSRPPPIAIYQFLRVAQLHPVYRFFLLPSESPPRESSTTYRRNFQSAALYSVSLPLIIRSPADRTGFAFHHRSALPSPSYEKC